MVTKKIIICVLCFTFFGTTAFARVTPNVPPDDPVYRDIDKLIALGYAPATVVGQKPYARSEIARLVGAAIEHDKETTDVCETEEQSSLKAFSKCTSRQNTVRGIINRLKKDYHEELVDQKFIEGESRAIQGHGWEKFNLETVYLDSPNVLFPVDNGVGLINAIENPLRDDNLGRNATYGFQQAIETTHRLELSRYLALYASPRFEVDIPQDGSDMTGHAYIQNLYAITGIDYIALEFGRDSLMWGVGEHGDLMLSDNPRPLDLIKITNPKPARLPWVFKYLGQWKYTLFGANLGPDCSKKYAWLAGWKLSLLPAQYVELGFGHAVMMGGEGAPPLSALEVVGEFFGFRPAGSDPNSPNKTNHMMEAELLVRIPQLRGAEIYGVITNEDKRDTIKRFLRDGSGYVAGVYLPALLPSGATDLRLEFQRTPAIMYRHTIYDDGWTLNRKVIGSSLGPDGLRLRAVLGQTISPKLDFRAELAWDRRNSNLKTQTTDPDGSLGDIVTAVHRPAEDRYRFLIDALLRTKKHFDIKTTVGYERAHNFNFVQGDSRNNFLFAVSLDFNFDRYFGFAAK